MTYAREVCTPIASQLMPAQPASPMMYVMFLKIKMKKEITQRKLQIGRV